MSIVNLENVLSVAPTPGGTWVTGRCDGSLTNSVDISTPTAVDFAGEDDGTYYFSYSLTSGLCTSCVEAYIN